MAPPCNFSRPTTVLPGDPPPPPSPTSVPTVFPSSLTSSHMDPLLKLATLPYSFPSSSAPCGRGGVWYGHPPHTGRAPAAPRASQGEEAPVGNSHGDTSVDAVSWNFPALCRCVLGCFYDSKHSVCTYNLALPMKVASVPELTSSHAPSYPAGRLTCTVSVMRSGSNTNLMSRLLVPLGT